MYSKTLQLRAKLATLSEKQLERKYFDRVARISKFVKCEQCDMVLLPRNMWFHIQSKHTVTIENICIWCLQYTWTNYTKETNIHRFNCLQKKVIIAGNWYSRKKKNSRPNIMHTIETLALPSPPVSHAQCHDLKNIRYLYNSQMMNIFLEQSSYMLRRNMEYFQHYSDEIDLYENFEDSHQLPEWITSEEGIEDPLHLLYFSNQCTIDESFGFNVKYQLAFTYKPNLQWYRLNIRFDAWRTFWQFYKNNNHIIHCLPFWCLATHNLSGNNTNTLHLPTPTIIENLDKHYRCMIVVTQQQNCLFVEDFINELMEAYLDDQGTWIQNITKTKLNNIDVCNLNLINAIEQVSVSGEGRYFIANPSDPMLKLTAMLVIHKGIYTYLNAMYSEAFPWSAPTLKRNTDINKWVINIVDLCQNENGFLFPLPRNMELYIIPSENFEMPSMFLFAGVFIYGIRVNNSLLSLTIPEWNTHQLSNYNNFFDVLQTQEYVLPDASQKLLTTTGYLVDTFQNTIHKLNDQIKTLKNKQ